MLLRGNRWPRNVRRSIGGAQMICCNLRWSAAFEKIYTWSSVQKFWSAACFVAWTTFFQSWHICPSIHVFSACPHKGADRLTLGKRWGTSWTGRQPIKGHLQTNNHSNTHSYRWIILKKFTCMFFLMRMEAILHHCHFLCKLHFSKSPNRSGWNNSSCAQWTERRAARCGFLV